MLNEVARQYLDWFYRDYDNPNGGFDYYEQNIEPLLIRHGDIKSQDRLTQLLGLILEDEELPEIVVEMEELI